MSGSFYSVFGGNAVGVAQPSFLPLTIAANTALAWPIESSTTPPYVAALMNVTASAGGLSLAMPPGNTGSTGVATIISNVGSNTFTLTDQAGNAITTLATTQVWVIALTSNTTTNGTWSAIQLGATTSSATASSLAGAGLQASSTLLRINFPITNYTVGSTISPSFRGTIYNWTGSTPGFVQFNAAATLGAGFIMGFANNGTAAVTFSTTGGDTINGNGTSLVVEPGNSGFFGVASGNIVTLGALTGALSVLNGGTGATTSGQALINLGGTTLGIGIFTAATAASVVSLLGLSNSTFQETSISASQPITSGSSNLLFVATSALTLTLALTTGLTTKFVFCVNAFGGNVTLTPAATDKINGGSVAASITIPQGDSAMVTMDGNGNWYTLFSSSFGNKTINGALVVTGQATLGSLSVQTGASVTSGLSVGGALTVGSNLTVAAGAAIGGTTGVNTLTVANGASVTNGLTVVNAGVTVTAGGASITAGGLKVAAGGANVTGAVAIAGSLDATGVVTAANGVTTGQVVNYGQFPTTLGGTGSFALPSGAQMKWGSGTSSTGGNVTINYVANFPTATRQVIATVTGSTPGTYVLQVFGFANNGFQVLATLAGAGTSGIGFSWIAIGD
jgi:hypothetical protein